MINRQREINYITVVRISNKFSAQGIIREILDFFEWREKKNPRIVNASLFFTVRLWKGSCFPTASTAPLPVGPAPSP
jgi:hypothetical protein